MTHAPTAGPRIRRSAVILFSNTYPFGRGEEFLESEIPHLLQSFDRVIVVPTMHLPTMAQTRELPEGAVLVDSYVNRSATVASFSARHPISVLRSLKRALRARKRAHVVADLKFDLYSIAVARKTRKGIQHAIIDIDDLVLYGFWLHVPARVALEIQRMFRIPGATVVSRANGFDIYSERRVDDYLPQRNYLLSNLGHVIAASSTAEEYLRERFPEFAEKFTTDRIGTPPPINPGNADRTLSHLVSCSYIVPVKRLKMLIDDIAEAQHAGTRDSLVKWTHIGSGAEAYVHEVTEYAAQKLIPGSFQFLGYMDSQELRRWYADNPASAFVQMSESEGGLAASIQEGLAQGLPVIATAVGGVRALAEDTHVFKGLLAADHTPKQFAERLTSLLTSDDDEYQGYISASMNFWRQNCAADTLASAFARRLRKLATSIRQA